MRELACGIFTVSWWHMVTSPPRFDSRSDYLLFCDAYEGSVVARTPQMLYRLSLAVVLYRLLSYAMSGGSFLVP